MKQQQKCAEYQYFTIVLLFTCSLLLGNLWLPGRNRFLPPEAEETGKNMKKFENG